MYSVVWSPKAQEGLAALPKDMAKRIIDRVEQIKHTPYHFAEHLTDVKAWKLRIGDYRIIMDIDEKEKSISILKVGHRKNVYKK
ncbi:MAG: type II toxin-antitoxin system RelE/ParE family toxin [Candidatus Micrarchaeota archaeon]